MPEPRPDPRTALPTPAESARPLLLIEDDPDGAELLRELLEIEGYEVVWTADAAGAEQVFRRQVPALVLTDLNLKDVHGIVLARRLHSLLNEGAVAPPFWAMTGHTEAEVRAMEGAQLIERVLQKPVDVDQLLAWLAERLPR
jgi:DNA-binding response OmpR family regulator